jgi:hypothetical protein
MILSAGLALPKLTSPKENAYQYALPTRSTTKQMLPASLPPMPNLSRQVDWVTNGATLLIAVSSTSFSLSLSPIHSIIIIKTEWDIRKGLEKLQLLNNKMLNFILMMGKIVLDITL